MMPVEDRAARRRRERAEAKLYRRIDESYKQADRVAPDLLGMLDRMYREAVSRGWDDATPWIKGAVRAVHEGNGLEMQRCMARAAELINVHQPPE